ncbi:MAG: type II toxin-antitoxin system prevent-host-death family antitoxin [Deltaproteobacteria bacterium]|nr:type II toxin-antitoxin system prevent-host-death family antitoxin [Deltaproteobacteria bacterium]
MTRLTASKLRENIYRVLDRVAATGEPVEIVRKGTVLRIVPPRPISRLAHLPKRKVLRVAPEAIVHCDWSKEWKP